MHSRIEYDEGPQMEKHPAELKLEKLRKANAEYQRAYRLKMGDKLKTKNRKRMRESRKK
jgi:hypothetical protein